MIQPAIRFDDGDAYERGMGPWGQLAGDVFLDWLEPRTGLRWLDVGCGNGVFSELIARRCAPVELQGVDPAEVQLAFARTRPTCRDVTFLQGDAMALPFDANRFDAAVMALVLFFVPDPAKGLAEMARVVRPGGSVSAYVWDILGDGSPSVPIQEELRAFGVLPVYPPNAAASRLAALGELWAEAGLQAIETREITVQRRFADFGEFWRSITALPGQGPRIAALAEGDVAALQARLRVSLPADVAGRIAYSARANAIKGTVPQ